MIVEEQIKRPLIYSVEGDIESGSQVNAQLKSKRGTSIFQDLKSASAVFRRQYERLSRDRLQQQIRIAGPMWTERGKGRESESEEMTVGAVVRMRCGGSDQGWLTPTG